ncbi:MAG: hypothetical protein HC814_05605 [Rhodobacteraceae bacterium]|nr:hypothetical protein [Paracoccaceae bacterium]
MDMGVGSLVIVALLSFSAFSGRSFAALTNYTELDARSRNALDLLSRDVRRSSRLVSYTPQRIELADGAGVRTVYAFDATGRTLSRIRGGQTDELLTGVDWLRFLIFQRTPVGGTYEYFPVTVGVATAKVVQIDWICSRSILGARQNTESVQSAKIILRSK